MNILKEIAKNDIEISIRRDFEGVIIKSDFYDYHQRRIIPYTDIDKIKDPNTILLLVFEDMIAEFKDDKEQEE